MDANCDQKLSREEHAGGARTLFAWMDTNHDGYVTAAEMDAMKGANKGRDPGELSSVEKIDRLDRDRDGRLSAEEHADGAASMFSRMDRDADGLLTAEELQHGHDESLRRS